MCGRFSLTVSEKKIQQQLPFLELGNQKIQASYNIAPTQNAYVVTNEAPQQLSLLSWGLIPFWAKDEKIRSKLINARSEGIESKPSFRHAIRNRRCLVLADSFYEWRKTPEGKKMPLRLLPKEGPLLLMAGIWDIWEQPTQPISTFSIITTTPNKEVSPIHHRMPVVLPDLDRQLKWLEEGPLEEVLDLLRPVEDGFFDIYPVSAAVNSPRNNDPSLHNPLPETPDLFS